MEKDYAYKMRKIVENDYKLAKKRGEYYSDNLKREIDRLLHVLENSSKIEMLYKFKYSFLNNGITIPELEDIYIKLFKKIIFTDENSIIFTNWENIFSSIFGNIPRIYNKHGKDIVNRIITMFCNTKNENKLDLLLKLFVRIYNIESEDIKYVNLLLDYINKTEEDYILKSYEIVVIELSDLCDGIFIGNDKIEEVFKIFANSKSKYNSKNISDLFEILMNNYTKNKELFNLLKIVSESENRDLIDSLLLLMKNDNFINLEDKYLQDKCINLLKNVNINSANIRLIAEIILDIIIVTDNNYIQDYLIEKIKYIKTTESLKLILMLTPILNEFSNEDEYVRVIDLLEDKDNNLTKKLVINLNNV